MSSKKPDTYKKLTDVLSEWFDKPLGDIPKEIQKTIKVRYKGWSKLTPKQRRSAAELMDKPFEPLQHDPEAEELDQRDFELVFELHKWENMDAKGIPSEEAIKEKKIREIEEEISKLGELFRDQSNFKADKIGLSVKELDKKKIQSIGGKLRNANPGATVTDIKSHYSLSEYLLKYSSNHSDFVGKCLKEIGIPPGKKGVRPHDLPINPFKKN